MGFLEGKWDNRWVGLAIGMFFPCLIIYGVNIYNFPDLTFSEFLTQNIKFRTLGTWLKPAVIFNLAPFMLFINTYRMKIAQGVVFATIFYAVIIVYLMFF
jgi:tetrahydromethanopterin S-methyltransferase subunit F